MKKRIFVSLIAVLVISALFISASFAAEKVSFGTKVKNFWRRLVGYPARVTEESASVVADTTKRSADVVSNAAKRVGEVTTGDVEKTKENTVTLYAASPDTNKNKNTLQYAIQTNGSIRNSIVVPVGLKDDTACLIRGVLFGLRLIYISRHKDDVRFIIDTISDYRSLIESYGLSSPDLKVDDILTLFGSNVPKIVAVLMMIIKSLPIKPIPPDEMLGIDEKAGLIMKAA